MSSTPTPSMLPPSNQHAVLARRLDLLAGCELQHGHHIAAEHLARQAAVLRDGAR